MLNLFNEYKEKGKITEALIIGRNMVNRDPGNADKMEAFLQLLLLLSENLPSLDERKEFIGQAKVTLAFFSENVEMSEKSLEKIQSLDNQIEQIANKLLDEENSRLSNHINEIEKNNNKFIKELYRKKQLLDRTDSQQELDNILGDISRIDEMIQHDYMTEEQKTYYAQLNRECTSSISEKMRALEYKNNVVYNKRAVESYSNAFKTFKRDESKYKNETHLFSLVSSTLFAYDASKLFNETLIYYNHVYSYIFSKLDDDGKLTLTRYAIECERKKR